MEKWRNQPPPTHKYTYTLRSFRQKSLKAQFFPQKLKTKYNALSYMSYFSYSRITPNLASRSLKSFCAPESGCVVTGFYLNISHKTMDKVLAGEVTLSGYSTEGRISPKLSLVAVSRI